MPEEFSPEEKLLKLIRGEKKQKERPAAEKTEPPRASPEPLKSSAGIPLAKLQGAGQPAGDRTRHFKVINSALIAILILIIVFFIFDIVTSNLKPRRLVGVQKEHPVSRGAEHAARPTSEDINQAATAPFSAYADVGRRELFKPVRSEVQERAASQAASESAQDKLKDLSLIGIIAGEKPQAVIEDRKIQKTYFLNKGQAVNQLTVEDILEDRVIFDFEGEKLELDL